MRRSCRRFVTQLPEVLQALRRYKYLGRKQFKVKEKGFAVAGEGGPKEEKELPQSIYARIAEGYEFA